MICLMLAVGTLVLYWPMTHHDFINVDDPRFVLQNPHVQGGFTWQSFVWAFKSLYVETWQPVTWFTHMFDCQMYGLKAGGHHLTSLLFHLASSLLLFLWLDNLTRATGRSALVAALFAWHPLHVESVAWICERKDMVSAFFWLLALLAYARYARKPGAGGYLLVLGLFAMGLMSKPMVVTLPCVLLLLDFWPLNRFGLIRTADEEKTPRPDAVPNPAANINFPALVRKTIALTIEKIPFFVLGLAMTMATIYAEKAGGTLVSLASLPLRTRVANALMSYQSYLTETFWPAGLAFFYPYSSDLPLALVLGAALLLLIWTGLFAMRARQQPYLLTGWLYFLGTLAPTIGLIQYCTQSKADRYMYIPSIGLFIVIVWGVNDLFGRWRAGRKFLPVLGSLALAGCFAVTSIQLSYWQNSVTLSAHAIDVTRNNYVAYESLGRAFYERGDKTKAYACYAQSIKLEPDFPQSQYNYALLLREFGRLPEAAEHFAATVKLVPDRYEARTALGSTLLLMPGRPAEAAAQFAAAVRLKPDSAEAHHGLALALARQGDLTNALPEFAAAARLAPTDPNMCFDLGLTLLNTRQPKAAAAEFTAELQLAPNETRAHFRLAQALEQQNQFAGALAHYQAALNLTTNFPEAAAALARIRAAHPDLPPRDPLDIPR
jgi:tetratricopeptide (TPR) repeat protein